MKSTSAYLFIAFLASVVLDLDKEALTIFLSSGVATLSRILYEKTHNKKEFKLYRILMIVLVSTWLPYTIHTFIDTVDFLSNLKLFVLFSVGILAIDIAEIVIKQTPEKIKEIINLIPLIVKKKAGLKDETDRE